MHLGRVLCALLCLLVVRGGEATLSKKDKKGKKKREQVDPQDPFIGLCESNIYAYSTMSTSAFIAWATSLCDSKKLGTSSGYLYVAC